MDLGLAQLADEAEGRLTRTRQFVGTLRYASPEQVLAVPLDRRSDVYSLGATLWELLTLRPLFGATDQTPTPDLMLKIQHAEPERPRQPQPAGARGPGSDRPEVPGEGPRRGATPRRASWPPTWRAGCAASRCRRSRRRSATCWARRSAATAAASPWSPRCCWPLSWGPPRP